MILVFFIITFMCFVLIRMLPLPTLPPGDIHYDVIMMRREALGYNKPYIEQFAIFLRGLFTRFDWGLSEKLYTGQPVLDVFLMKLPPTMIVNLYSILWTIPIGIALGRLFHINADDGRHFGAIIRLCVPCSVHILFPTEVVPANLEGRNRLVLV